MLRKNPLHPPRPFPSADSSPARAVSVVGGEARQSDAAAGFLSADAFDPTGILLGVDPAEPCYWWMPELYGPDGAAGSGDLGPTDEAQAATRSADTTAA
jgi:hypothetical protein